MLIENKDKVVSRDFILDHIWKGRIVSDTSINNHIKSARKVFGDDGQKQTVIKTLCGRGYKFIASVAEEVNNDTIAKPVTKTFINKASILTGFVLFVFAFVFFMSQYTNLFENKQQQTDHTPAQDRSIAVLAFKDLSLEFDQEYFSEGLSEELLNLFTKIPNLRVARRTSVFLFKNQVITIEEIGKILNVGYVLEGSVRN